MACFFGHKWNGCKCERCGKTRSTGHKWDGGQCSVCHAPNPDAFCLEVCGKYSAYGGMFAEGYLKYGQLRVGDTVYLYDEKGRAKAENARVQAILNSSGVKTDSVRKEGDEKTYAAVMMSGVANLGDIDRNDVISRQKLTFEAPAQEEPPAAQREMPKAKIYNDPDRKKNVAMATNDLAAMCASGSLAANRQYVRDVAEDLYNAHGFEALQELFINVKTRYPAAQRQLSSILDGVGGWAD